MVPTVRAYRGARAIGVAAALLAFACESSTAPGVPVSLRIAPDSAVLLEFDTLTLRAVLIDSSSREIHGRAVAWVSSDTTVVHTLGDGRVVGDRAGEATVYAASEGEYARARVRVVVRLAEVSVGRDVCGISTRGSAYCTWARPVRVAARLALHGISSGQSHSCALDTAGRGWCWGWNGSGQLGDGTTTSTDTPVAVQGGARFLQIRAGAYHSCGITRDHQVLCWGSNTWSQLGTGDVTDRPTPTPVVGGGLWAAVSAGTEHTCGLREDGTAWCWGDAGYGRLGNGVYQGYSSVPAAVGGVHAFASISAGSSHTCGVATDGAAWCWGQNWYGQLGAYTVEVCGSADLHCSTIPARVDAPGTKWRAVASSANPYHGGYTCGLIGDRSARCWGAGGHLGDGTSNGSTQPVVVAGGLRFTSLSAGVPACSITTDGVAWCWGGSFGTSPTRLPFQP